jgi:hypothetical protein
MKFKVGDKVRIKPFAPGETTRDRVDSSVGWAKPMEDLMGQELEISHVRDDYYRT